MTRSGLFEMSDVGIEGRKIAFVGKAPLSFQADKIIDAHDCIIMPSLVNAHTHLSMELMRNYKDTASNLMAWLNEIFPIENKLVENDILWASRLGVCELIQSGCTLFNDMYFMQHRTAQAANEGGIRACIGMTLFGDEEDSKQRLAQKSKETATQISESEGRLHLDVAPHAIYTCTKGSYLYAHDWAKDHHCQLHTHLSETKGEVENCVKEHGKTPLNYLLEMGYFNDTKHVLAHCVHLTEDEMETLASLDASVVNNPTSNCKLASGIAPIGRMLGKHINVALGTDGSSSNNNQNMFEEMHVASLVSTALTGDITSLPPYQVLEMATINGAKALGFPEIGTLEAGKDADLIIIDTHKSHLTPLNDPFSALVYSTQASDVDTVFCQGKIVMEHRKITGIDLDETIRQTEICWQDIKSR